MEPEYLHKPEEFRHPIKNAKKPQNRPVPFLLEGAGLRAGEMTKVRVEDKNIDDCDMHIEAESSKEGNGRIVIPRWSVIAKRRCCLAKSAVSSKASSCPRMIRFWRR
jgi:hypothetical protein